MNDIDNWYFTFGFSSEHKSKYVKFVGTHSSAMQQMVNQFGMNWSMQYSEDEFLHQISDYGLTELET